MLWFCCVVSHHVFFLELDYYSLCVKQPIGRRLFQLFCRSRPDLQNYISLLDALVHLEQENGIYRIPTVQKYRKHILKPTHDYVNSVGWAYNKKNIKLTV